MSTLMSMTISYSSEWLPNLVKRLIHERKIAQRSLPMMEVETRNLPLKKRKLDDNVFKTKESRKKRQKKCNYYETLEKDVIYPRYRVALYDRYLVLPNGIRPGVEVTIRDYIIDQMGNIVWIVCEYLDSDYWTELEDNIRLL